MGDDSRPGPEEPGAPPDRADREHLRVLARMRRRRAIWLLVVLTLVVFILVFAIRNSQPVPIDYVLFERPSRLIWVMLTCAVAGGVVGFLLGRPGRRVRFHRDERPRADREG